MLSPLLPSAVADLQRLKQDVKQIAQAQLIAESKERLENDAKRMLEQILQDKQEDDEQHTETPAAVETEPSAETGEGEGASPVLTTLPVGDDFGFDAPGAAGGSGENEVTPTVTTTTDDQGNVDITIDTNPEAAGSEAGPEVDTAPIEGIAAPEAEMTSPAEGMPMGHGEEEVAPEEDNDMEELDMTNASADEILEKFCETSDNGSLDAIEQVAESDYETTGPAEYEKYHASDDSLAVAGDKRVYRHNLAQATTKTPRAEVARNLDNAAVYRSAVSSTVPSDPEGTSEYFKDAANASLNASHQLNRNPAVKSALPEEEMESDEDKELAAYLDEAIQLAKNGGSPLNEDEDDDQEGEQELAPLSEEEMADLEASINEDMLSDMTDGDGKGPSTASTDLPPAGADTPQGELEETIAHNHTNGRHKNAKPSNFPEERMRPTAVNESKAKTRQQVLGLTKQLMENIQALQNENKALKEQVGGLTTLNEGLEKDNRQYLGKFYDATLLAYKSGYANKLLMEQTTTKTQKEDILKSFNDATTRGEVENLYENYEKTLQKSEISPLNEGKSVAHKLAPVFTNEAKPEGTKTLNESVSSNPAIQRMLALVNYSTKEQK